MFGSLAVSLGLQAESLSALIKRRRDKEKASLKKARHIGDSIMVSRPSDGAAAASGAAVAVAFMVYALLWNKRHQRQEKVTTAALVAAAAAEQEGRAL
jgi:hypothetical protein